MFEIRRLAAADLEQAAQVVRQGFKTVTKEFRLTMENCAVYGMFMRTERLILDFMKGELMYGLYIDGMMAGFLQLAKNGDRVSLKKIVVLPQYRCQGYGSALMEFAEKQAAEWGASCLALSFIEEDSRLKQWYTHRGFLHTGVKRYNNLPFTVGTMEKSVLPVPNSLEA